MRAYLYRKSWIPSFYPAAATTTTTTAAARPPRRLSSPLPRYPVITTIAGRPPGPNPDGRLLC